MLLAPVAVARYAVSVGAVQVKLKVGGVLSLAGLVTPHVVVPAGFE